MVTLVNNKSDTLLLTNNVSSALIWSAINSYHHKTNQPRLAEQMSRSSSFITLSKIKTPSANTFLIYLSSTNCFMFACMGLLKLIVFFSQKCECLLGEKNTLRFFLGLNGKIRYTTGKNFVQK